MTGIQSASSLINSRQSSMSPSLFLLGLVLCCLHMVIPMSDMYSYSLDAIGLVLMFAAALFSKKALMRVDIVAGLLLSRTIWLIVVNTINGGSTALYLNNSFYSAAAIILTYQASTCITFSPTLRKAIRTGMSIIAIIVLSQILGCYIQIGTFSNFSVNKYLVSIPYGDSNSIAMGYVAMCLYLFLDSNRNVMKAWWCIAALIGLILLSSSGCILSIAIVALTLILKKVYEIASARVDARIVAIACAVVALIAVGIATGAFAPLIESFSGTTEKVLELFSGDISAATTGRTTIYAHYINLFLQSPVLGYGTVPAEGVNGILETYRPHNLVLEALYHGGIVNFALYASACVYAFKGTRKDSFGKTARIVAAFLLINSMFEPGVFGFNKDFLMWLLLGLAQKREVTNAKR